MSNKQQGKAEPFGTSSTGAAYRRQEALEQRSLRPANVGTLKKAFASLSDDSRQLAEDTGLQPLLKLTQHEHARLKALSRVVIESLISSEEADAGTVLDSSTGWPALVEILSYRDTQAQEVALFTLAALAKSNSSNAEEIMRYVGLKTVMAMGTAKDVTPGVRIAAVELLTALANYDDLHDELLSHASGPMHEQWMRLAERDPNLKRAITAFFSTLSANGARSDSTDALVQRGNVVQWLAAALLSPDVDTSVGAASALAHLADQSVDYAQLCVTHGVVRSAVTLSRDPKSVEKKRAGAYLLARLAQHTDCHAALQQAAVLDAVLDIMLYAQTENDKEALFHAVSCLNACAQSKEMAALIKAPKLMKELQRMMKHTDDDIRREVEEALAEIGESAASPSVSAVRLRRHQTSSPRPLNNDAPSAADPGDVVGAFRAALRAMREKYGNDLSKEDQQLLAELDRITSKLRDRAKASDTDGLGSDASAALPLAEKVIARLQAMKSSGAGRDKMLGVATQLAADLQALASLNAAGPAGPYVSEKSLAHSKQLAADLAAMSAALGASKGAMGKDASRDDAQLLAELDADVSALRKRLAGGDVSGAESAGRALQARTEQLQAKIAAKALSASDKSKRDALLRAAGQLAADMRALSSVPVGLGKGEEEAAADKLSLTAVTAALATAVSDARSLLADEISSSEKEQLDDLNSAVMMMQRRAAEGNVTAVVAAARAELPRAETCSTTVGARAVNTLDSQRKDKLLNIAAVLAKHMRALANIQLALSPSDKLSVAAGIAGLATTVGDVGVLLGDAATPDEQKTLNELSDTLAAMQAKIAAGDIAGVAALGKDGSAAANSLKEKISASANTRIKNSDRRDMLLNAAAQLARDMQELANLKPPSGSSTPHRRTSEAAMRVATPTPAPDLSSKAGVAVLISDLQAALTEARFTAKNSGNWSPEDEAALKDMEAVSKELQTQCAANKLARVVAISEQAKPKSEALGGKFAARALALQDADARDRLLQIAGQLARDMERLSKLPLPADQQKLVADERNQLQRRQSIPERSEPLASPAVSVVNAAQGISNQSARKASASASESDPSLQGAQREYDAFHDGRDERQSVVAAQGVSHGLQAREAAQGLSPLSKKAPAKQRLLQPGARESINAATMRLGKGGTDAQKATEEMLQLVNEDENREFVLEAGAIPAIVEQVKNFDGANKKQQLQLLEEVAKNEKNAMAISEAGGLEVLLDGLKRIQGKKLDGALDDWGDSILAALRAILTLAQNEKNVSWLRDAGLIYLLVPMINEKWLQVSILCMEILTLLCWHNVKSQLMFRDAKGEKVMENVLKQCKYVEMQGCAAQCLAAFAGNNPKFTRLVIDHNVHRRITDLLERGVGLPERVLVQLCLSVVNITEEDEYVQRAFGESKIAPKMCQLIQHPSELVQAQALNCIRCLARNHLKFSKVIGDLGATRDICRKFKSTNKQVQLAAGGALFELVRNNKGVQEQVVTPELVPFILAAVEEDDINMVYFSLGVIWLTAMKHKLRRQMWIDAGAIESAHPHRTSMNEQVRKGAMAVIDVLEGRDLKH